MKLWYQCLFVLRHVLINIYFTLFKTGINGYVAQNDLDLLILQTSQIQWLHPCTVMFNFCEVGTQTHVHTCWTSTLHFDCLYWKDTRFKRMKCDGWSWIATWWDLEWRKRHASDCVYENASREDELRDEHPPSNWAAPSNRWPYEEGSRKTRLPFFLGASVIPLSCSTYIRLQHPQPSNMVSIERPETLGGETEGSPVSSVLRHPTSWTE